MKKIVFLILTFCISVFCFSQKNKELNRAIEFIKEFIPEDSLNKMNVYISREELKPKTKIKLFNKEILSPDYNSWFVFIDDMPNKGWTHPCRYVFMNLKNNEYMIIKGKLPPKVDEMISINFVENGPPETGNVFVKSPRKKKTISLKSSTTINNLGRNYAVVISGGMNRANNWRRYWNDCSAIYRCLTTRYGYLDTDIYVLMSDGTSTGLDRRIGLNTYDSSPLDLDGDGDNDIDFSAKKTNISQVFNTLRSRVTDKDHVFIYTTDHGDNISGWDVQLLLWGETITDKEFAAEVDKINHASSISIVMEQCYSGGFIDDLQGGNRVIATACRHDELSCGSGTYTQNEFVHHWTAAVNGTYPDGTVANADSNGDGYISMQETFIYARDNDNCTETPQYSSINQSYGFNTTMFGLELCSNLFEIKNEVITSYKSFKNNCKIKASNITISNGASVIFDAGLDIRIVAPFKVNSGSTLKLE